MEFLQYILKHLSETFDCILHELMLPKLHAYGFDKISLTLYILAWVDGGGGLEWIVLLAHEYLI